MVGARVSLVPPSTLPGPARAPTVVEKRRGSFSPNHQRTSCILHGILPSIATRVHIVCFGGPESTSSARKRYTRSRHPLRQSAKRQWQCVGNRESAKPERGPRARRFVGTARAIAQEFPSEHSGVIPRVAADIKTPCHFVLCVTKWPKQGSSRQMTWCDLTQRTPSNRNIPAKHLWRPTPQPLQHLILACPSIHRLRME